MVFLMYKIGKIELEIHSIGDGVKKMGNLIHIGLGRQWHTLFARQF